MKVSNDLLCIDSLPPLIRCPRFTYCSWPKWHNELRFATCVEEVPG